MFQLVVICETALADPPLAAGLEAAADAGAEDDAAVLGVVDAVEELDPLEQADIAVTSSRPSAGAR
ncbi:MAG: hypothetical protein ACRDOI_03410 [Trebonia sp.]